MMPGFYWLVEGELAGCSRPGERAGRRGERAPETPGDGDLLQRDLAWLRAQGIRAVLSLTETPLPEEAVRTHGLVSLHVPVPDLYPPSPDQLMLSLSFVDRQRSQSRPVVVHCLVGQGRTGTVLAAYLIRAGASPDGALRELRSLCPGAVGTPEQERALHSFAARQDWIL